MGAGHGRGRLPAAALTQQVNKEWSFAQTLRHLVFITDAWASRTVLDEEMPYHPLGLPQSWYPAADAAAVGIDLTAQPGYAEILAARADRMALMRRIVASLTNAGLGRLCQRSPAPGYPDEQRTVIDCVSVVMDEEIEHYRFAVRDLAVLEAGLASFRQRTRNLLRQAHQAGAATACGGLATIGRTATLTRLSMLRLSSA